MASKQSSVDFFVEQMTDAGDVSARKMFGEYGVYCDGKVVALVCDDQLFVKPTAAGRALIGKVTEGLPYPGAKPWFVVAGSDCENSDWLSELIRLTARELPLPKPKKPKPKPAKTAQRPKSKPDKAAQRPKPKAKAKATKKRAPARSKKAPSKR